jgi:hypothetical protein
LETSAESNKANVEAGVGFGSSGSQDCFQQKALQFHGSPVFQVAYELGLVSL